MKSVLLPRRSPLYVLIFLAFLGAMLGAPRSVRAHAELVRTEPPINGLVVASPDQLKLYFTEDVAPDNPVPTVRVLDDQGNEQGVSILPPQGRELIVNIPSLHPGVWTVSWSVRSDTDGHQLSGTYAFRVGGGLPAGAATTSGETPDAWAVVARWLTFFGAAIAAAGFLFGVVDPRDRMPASRLTATISGAAVALLATISEPILLQQFPPNDTPVSFGEALRSLPDAWWIRPPALLLAALTGAFALYALRRRVPMWMSMLGGVFSLVALLGLSFTSHAAGRDSWREVAVASDVVHQWSVALWVGGLIHLVLAWTTDDQVRQSGAVRRFSRYALVLFGLGVFTGVANAAFVFPALDTLWNSDYGYVLIAKVLVLLVPLALAVYHRRVIGMAKAIPMVFRSTLRAEAVLAVLVLLGGATLALSAPPVEEESGPDHVTLFQFETNDRGETVGLVHLRISPVRQGDNEIDVWLTDTQGNVVTDSTAPGVALHFTSLDHGTLSNVVNLTPTDTVARRYSAEGLDLSLDGWWQIDATITSATSELTHASFYLLLPDPNVHGSSAAPSPDDNPDARAVFDRAVVTMQSRQKFKWSESINTGDDTMVLVNYGQIAEARDQPASVEQVLAYSGSFASRSDGSLPPPPTTNTYHSVSIDDESWLVQEDGTWLKQPAGRYGLIATWGSIYEQAEYLRFGGTAEIDGRQMQLISFHTPNQTGQSEAWFCWWVDVETGEVNRIAMVAASHYMVWTYSEFDGSFQIGPPPADSEGTPVATPAA